LHAEFLSLESKKVLPSLNVDVILWERSAERSPSAVEVGEVCEDFLEENGPLHADELEEDCLK